MHSTVSSRRLSWPLLPALVALSALLSACPSAPQCESDEACGAGEVCVANKCQPAPDTGDGGEPDGGVDPVEACGQRGQACCAEGSACGEGLKCEEAVCTPDLPDVQGPVTVFVGRSGDGAGTVTLSYTSPEGGDVSRPATDSLREVVREGTRVTLTVQPEAGSRFVGWGGACTGSNSTCTLDVQAPVYVTVTFSRSIGVSVSLEGEGSGTVRSSPEGLSCPDTCQAEFASGSTVTLTPESAEGSLFAGWSGACAGMGECKVPVSKAQHVVARFMPAVELSVQKAGNGNGTLSSVPAGIDCGETCSAPFVGRSTVRLSASPDATSLFMGWSGAGCTGTGFCEVTMDQAHLVTATFSPTFRLNVVKQGAGTGTVSADKLTCGTACSSGVAEYADGTVVTLTATPSETSVFAGWSGACTGTSPTCTLTLDVMRTVYARFIPLHALTVATDGGDGAGSVTSAPAGIDCGTSCTTSYAEGTAVTLSATPAAGSVFEKWVVEGKPALCQQGRTCPLSMTTALSVKAHFRRLYTVTLDKKGQGKLLTSNNRGVDNITCEGTCSTTSPASGPFPSGSTVQVKAEPAEGWRLVKWTGSCLGTPITSATCTLSSSLSVDMRAGAEFGETRVLTVTKSGSGTGTLAASANPNVGTLEACGTTKTSCTGTFLQGAQMTVSATAASDSLFVEWTGGCTGTNLLCSFPLDSNTTVNALFDKAYKLTVSRVGSGKVVSTEEPPTFSCTGTATTCDRTYRSGTVVTLKATADASNVFTGWGGACSGTSDTCTVTMSEARGVTANFKKLVRLTVTKDVQGAAGATVASSDNTISCGSTCEYDYAEGTSVTLSVSPDARTSFNGWGGNCASAGFGPCTLTLTGTGTWTAQARLVEAWPRRLGTSGNGSATPIEEIRGIASDSAGNLFVTGVMSGKTSLGGSVIGNDKTVVFLAKYAADGAHLWSRTLAVTTLGDGANRGFSVAVDGNGNPVVAGTFGLNRAAWFGDEYNNPNDPGPLPTQAQVNRGGTDAFVARYDGATGALQWVRPIGSANDDLAYSVAVDGTNAVVVAGVVARGATAGSDVPVFTDGGAVPSSTTGAQGVFVARYTTTATDATLAWVKRLPMVGEARAVAVDGGANVYVAGVFSASGDFGGGALTSAGNDDGFLASYSSTGAFRFGKRLGSSLKDSVDSLVVSQGLGLVFVSGTAAAGSVDFNGDGVADLPSSMGSSVFVGGYDAFFNGDYMGLATSFSGVTQTFVANGIPVGPSLALDASGNVAVAGSFTGTLMYTDANGQPGSLTSAGGSDAFFLRLTVDPMRVVVGSAKKFGGTGSDLAARLTAQGPAGAKLGLVGMFVGSGVGFDGRTLNARDTSDLFIHVVAQ